MLFVMSELISHGAQVNIASYSGKLPLFQLKQADTILSLAKAKGGI